MPERMMIENSRLCKFSNKKPGEIIKINTGKMTTTQKKGDKDFRKSVFGKEEKDFTELVMEVTKQDADKLDAFVEYCRRINKCVNCNKKIDLAFFHSNDHDEIEMTCKEYCMGTTIDSAKESKDYVVWLNKILEEYDTSFKDGFPKAMRCQFGKICPQCKGSHDGGIMYFDMGNGGFK